MSTKIPIYKCILCYISSLTEGLYLKKQFEKFSSETVRSFFVTALFEPLSSTVGRTHTFKRFIDDLNILRPRYLTYLNYNSSNNFIILLKLVQQF